MAADAARVRLARAPELIPRLAALLDRRAHVVLAGLCAVNVLVVLHEALRVIHHDGWIYGDPAKARRAWAAAHDLGTLHRPHGVDGYGLPLLEAPVAAFAGVTASTGWVVLVNVLVLGPLAMVALYGAGTRIAGRLFGLWACLLWIVVPPIVLHLYRVSNLAAFRDTFFPLARGLAPSEEYGAMVSLICAAWLLLRAQETRAVSDGLLAGAVCGLAVGFDPRAVLFLPAAVLALATARSARVALAAAGGFAPVLLTRALLERGDPGLADAWRGVHFSWRHLDTTIKGQLREVFGSNRVFELVLIAGTAALALRRPLRAAFLAVWVLAFLAVEGSSSAADVYRTTFFSLMEPAYPAILLLGASLVLAVPTGRRSARPAPPAPLSLRVAGGLAGAIVVVPLVALALAAVRG